MADDKKNDVIHQWYERIQRKDLDGLMELLHTDYVNHSAAEGAPRGRDGVQVSFGMWFFAFNELDLEIVDVFSHGNRSAAHVILRGVQDGEFMGHPASGKRVEFSMTELLHIQDELIIERWGTVDLLNLMVQLGFLAEPEMG